MGKVVEYRIHWGNEGDSEYIEYVEGKDWRYAREVVKQCEDGAIQYCDVRKMSIQWIERVEDIWCDIECSVTDSEYEILWSEEVA
jgi:hypothetical protein